MKKRNYTKERDKEIIPVAKDLLLALIARKDLMIGSSETVTTEKVTKYYRDIYLKVIIPTLIEKNIKLNDLEYLFQLMAQPVNFIKEITLSSFSMNKDISDAQLYGLKNIDELRVAGLDEKLKEFANKKK